MKFHETTFDEYIQSVRKYNYHPEMANELLTKTEDFPSKNRIFYGPSGTGKYSQVLNFLEPYSPSHLKYDKKMTIKTEKGDYTFRFSDVHYEIDMSLLGCNSRILWDVFFHQIVEIVSVRPDKRGILVCSNFHSIHNELLETFFSYYKQFNKQGDSLFNKNNIFLRYVLVTEHLSFIPPSILKSSIIVPVCRPSKQILCMNRDLMTKKIMNEVEPEHLNNLKEIHSFPFLAKRDEMPLEIFNKVCQPILDSVNKILRGSVLPCKESVGKKSTLRCRGKGEEVPSFDFLKFRDMLYDINVYQLDILECIWFVLSSIILENNIAAGAKPPRVRLGEPLEGVGEFVHHEHVYDILFEIIEFLKYYNNNYRTIYHFESIFYKIGSHE